MLKDKRGRPTRRCSTTPPWGTAAAAPGRLRGPRIPAPGMRHRHTGKAGSSGESTAKGEQRRGEAAEWGSSGAWGGPAMRGRRADSAPVRRGAAERGAAPVVTGIYRAQERTEPCRESGWTAVAGTFICTWEKNCLLPLLCLWTFLLWASSNRHLWQECLWEPKNLF